MDNDNHYQIIIQAFLHLFIEENLQQAIPFPIKFFLNVHL